MNVAKPIQRAAAWLILAGLVTGCGPAEGHGSRESEAGSTHAAHDHAEHGEDKHADHDERDHHDDHPHEDANDHEEAGGAGARFRPAQGVMFSKETAEILGLETAAVTEARVPWETRFTAQIFGERHRHLPDPANHAGCDVHGAGLVPADEGSRLTKGDTVETEPAPTPAPRGRLHGVVLSVQAAAASGEAEVIVGISNAISVLRPGEFVSLTARHDAERSTASIPEPALLRTAEGSFVYRAQGDGYLRTAVRVGARSGGRVSVLDGVQVGDRVVVKPVQTLWLVELRATKGGGHSH